MFLSAVWTLILTAPIHCRGSIGEQVIDCYVSPNLFWWKNKLIYNLNGLRLRTFPANVHSFRHCIKPDLRPIFGQQCTSLETLSLGICINFHNLKTVSWYITTLLSARTKLTVTRGSESIEHAFFFVVGFTEYVDLVLCLALLLWAVCHFFLRSASTYVNISAVQL